MIKFLWENLFKIEEEERDLTNLLKANYLFRELTNKELKFVRKIVHIRTYKPGEIIFKQGELGIGMYIVAQGLVNIMVEDFSAKEENKHTFITKLHRGDFFGEIALVEKNGKRTATAVARDNVTLIGFFKPDLEEIVNRNPLTGVKIVSRLGEVLGKRLKETADKFTELKKELKVQKINV